MPRRLHNTILFGAIAMMTLAGLVGIVMGIEKPVAQQIMITVGLVAIGQVAGHALAVFLAGREAAADARRRREDERRMNSRP